MIFKNPADRNPTDLQATLFGLTEEVLTSMPKDFRGLDFACGRHADFVRYMRQKGFGNFEGIDPKVRETEFLIKQLVFAPAPLPGSVPRPDSFYDLITSFQNPAFNGYFNLSKEKGKTLTDVINGLSTVWEVMRLLKPGAKALIYPSFELPKKMGRRLSRWNISARSELVDGMAALQYLAYVGESDFRMAASALGYHPQFLYRTIFEKEKD